MAAVRDQDAVLATALASRLAALAAEHPAARLVEAARVGADDLIARALDFAEELLADDGADLEGAAGGAR